MNDRRYTELKERYDELESTIEAIRTGQIDALVSDAGTGKQVFTLQSADITYRRLVESMNQGALTLSKDGIILYSNRYFSQLVGLPLEKVIGTKIFSMLPQSEEKRFRKWFKSSPKEIHKEFNLCNADGVMCPVLISIQLLEVSKSITVISMIVTDLSETKKAQESVVAHRYAEQELAHMKEVYARNELLRTVSKERSDLMLLNDAKDEFISLASHQLRTPATGVKQYVGMVLQGYAGDITTIQRDYLTKADQSNDRQLGIIDDLLNVAASDSGKLKLNLEPVDLIGFMQDVINEQMTKFTESNQCVVYEHGSEAIIARVDQKSFRMAIENVLDNARKYSYPGSVVTVSITKSEESIMIKIADQGVGIHKDDIGQLFKKFKRIDNPLSILSGGTGLGLYWSKQIIELHDGSIAIESEVGAGTTFIVTISI